eukprot:2878207-Pyramimonas_sp.AAC.1
MIGTVGHLVNFASWYRQMLRGNTVMPPSGECCELTAGCEGMNMNGKEDGQGSRWWGTSKVVGEYRISSSSSMYI